MLAKSKLILLTLLTLLSSVSLWAYDTQYPATVCGSGTYLFGCQQLTASGEYTNSVKTDSTVHLFLTFGNPKTVTYPATIEPGQQYLFGCQIVSAEADYTNKLQQAGCECDSTVVLKLKVQAAPVAKDTAVQYSATINEGEIYLFGCQQLKTTGWAENTLKRANGKDSIVHLYLTVVAAKDTAVQYSASINEGETYLFGCQPLTVAGAYDNTLKRANGKDSLVHLVLSINAAKDTAVQYSASINEGETYLFGCQPLTVAGAYDNTLKRANGADSLVHLVLSVNAAKDTAVQYSASINEGETYLFGCQPLTVAGAYDNTLKRANGADSLVHLVLSINAAKDTIVQYSAQIEPDQIYLFGCDQLQYDESAVGNTYDIAHSIPGASTGGDSIVHLLLTVIGKGSPTKEDTTVTYTATINKGETYLFGCQPLTTAGMYTNTVDRTGVYGDSIIYLNLKVNAAKDTAVQYEATIKQGETYLFGCQKLEVAGSYENKLEGAAASGGDSIVHLTLIVEQCPAQIVVKDTTAVICEGELPFKWHGMSLMRDTTMCDDTLKTTLGCDSIVRLSLTIKKAGRKYVTETACESFKWDVNGKTYTKSGEYVDTLSVKAANECDSIVTLYLTILQPVAFEGDTTTVTKCSGETYTWEVTGKTYNTTGIYRDTAFSNINTCLDTLFKTLNLKILDAADTVRTSDTICYNGDYEWLDKDNKLLKKFELMQESKNDTVPFRYAGQTCDSIIYMLQLTVLSKTDTIDDAQALCLGSDYTWKDNDGNTLKTFTNLTAEVKDTVKVQHAGSTCDSLVYTLNIAILLPTTGDTTAVKCSSFTWYGTEYTTSGNYEYTMTNKAGCDSVVTLHLTINQPTTGDTTAVECGAFTWYGTTYKEDGDYTYTMTNKAGCDSVVTLHLTIKDVVKRTIEETACDKFEWGGEILTKSGEYVKTYTAANECDSVVTLLLTIYQSAEKTVLYDTACVTYTWSVNGQEYKESAVVSETLKTIHGCDSVVELNLTILQPVVRDTAAEECNLFVWRDYTYINDTIVYDTIVGGASNGCDSIVKLSLKIGRPFVSELDLISKYGDRLLMINRTQINKLLADSLSRYDDTTLVKWYREAEPEDEFLGYGYYYTNDGQPVAPGTYYAVIEIPGTNGVCPAKGETSHYVVVPAKGAPALVPNYALPGQDIRVINLDPEQHTTIRIYTSEGILHGSYTTSGETTFTIKAANDHGFYLVELSDDSMKSTLRYIVK